MLVPYLTLIAEVLTYDGLTRIGRIRLACVQIKERQDAVDVDDGHAAARKAGPPSAAVHTRGQPPPFDTAGQPMVHAREKRNIGNDHSDSIQR